MKPRKPEMTPKHRTPWKSLKFWTPALPLPLAALAVALSLPTLPAAGQFGPVFVYGAEKVTYHRSLPGTSAVLFGLWRERLPGGGTRVEGRAEVSGYSTDQGEESQVQATYFAELELGRPVPPLSLWWAMDATTGETLLGAPTGTAIWPLSAESVKVESDRLEVTRERVMVLQARPGGGAWQLGLTDGGEADADGAVNGTVVALAADFDSVSPSSVGPAGSFRSGDRLLVVDVAMRAVREVVVSSPHPDSVVGEVGR